MVRGYDVFTHIFLSPILITWITFMMFLLEKLEIYKSFLFSPHTYAYLIVKQNICGTSI